MSNMSYCRFENTLADLEDCRRVLEEDELTGVNEYGEHLSEHEFNKALELISTCKEIASMFENYESDELREQYESNKAKSEEE